MRIQKSTMKLCTLFSLLSLWFLSLGTLPATAGETSETEKQEKASQATLPLDEILRLYRERDENTRKEEPPVPPVVSTLDQIRITGRLLDNGAEFQARIKLHVLSDKAWAKVPLFQRNEITHLTELPKVKNGNFIVEEETLYFITNKKGSYEFTVKFIQGADKVDGVWEIRIPYANATLAQCKIDFDRSSFSLHNTFGSEDASGITLLPEDNQFQISWTRTKASVPEKKKKKLVAPQIDSTVRSAHASVVSTLDGTNILRILYKLRFAGQKTIELSIPESQTLDRVYVNGIGSSTRSKDGKILVDITPLRSGDQSGTVELLLRQIGSGYFLSGALNFSLPSISWPTNEIFIDAHLPTVFNYKWTGGSLSPIQGSPSVKYVTDVPLPGKRMSFHQVLVHNSKPDVTIGYAVNLKDHFYQP